MSRIEERLAAALAATADTIQEETLRPLAEPEQARRRWPLILAPLAAAMAVVLIVAIEIGLGRMRPAGRPAGRPATPAAATAGIGRWPANMAFDPADKTIYVLHNGARTLTMVGTADCNASTIAGCDRIKQISTGGKYAADDVAVDEHTRTIYLVTFGGRFSTVAVINAATCNAFTASGCLPRAIVHVPPNANELAVNPRTDAIYVFYGRRAQMSVINGQVCNASDTSGCATAVATTAAPGMLDTPVAAVDPATNTLYYVASNTRLAVIDGRTCGATDVRGCGHPLTTAPIAGASALTIDQTTGTLYALARAVTVINRNTCDALTTTGCAGPLRAVRGGPSPVDAAVDPAANTVYMADAVGAAGVAMVNASACRATHLSGCPLLPAGFAAGAGPQKLVLDQAAHTLYVENAFDGTLSIISTATCNVADSNGCPSAPPAGTRQAPVNPARFSCDYMTSGYDSGLPAGPLVNGEVRVAGGAVDGLPWSLWARQGVPGPYGVEQGGLVVGGRWYGLCGFETARPRWNLEVIDAGAHGVVYGFVQKSKPVKIWLSAGAAGAAWPPSAVRTRGLTFFISRLPRPACAYPSVTAHFAATRKPLWSGYQTENVATCIPGWLVVSGGGSGGYGPGLGNS